MPDPPPTAPAADEALAAPRRGFLAAGWAKFSDNVIPSLVVAVIVGLVLFFFNETGDRITRLEAEHDARFIMLEENQQQIAVMLATLAGEFAAFREYVNNRFDAVDARFEAIETRLTRLEENQREIAVTLARLVALVEAHFEAPAIASG